MRLISFNRAAAISALALNVVQLSAFQHSPLSSSWKQTSLKLSDKVSEYTEVEQSDEEPAEPVKRKRIEFSNYVDPYENVPPYVDPYENESSRPSSSKTSSSQTTPEPPQTTKFSSPHEYTNLPPSNFPLTIHHDQAKTRHPQSTIPLLTVRVGDPALARKKWKKRRRSNSPILIPCTILGLADRQRALVWNIVQLLYRYGDMLSLLSSEDGWITDNSHVKARSGDRTKGTDGWHKNRSEVRQGTQLRNSYLGLSVTNMIRLYERDYGGSLLEHAKNLGHERIGDFLQYLFANDRQLQYDYQAQLLETKSSKNSSAAQRFIGIPSLSKYKARQLASQHCACTIQIDSENMTHTKGLTKTKTTVVDEDDPKSSSKIIQELPLTAAIRLNHDQQIFHKLKEGDVVQTYVSEFDEIGSDEGSPLLTVTLEPPKQQARRSVKPSPQQISRDVPKEDVIPYRTMEHKIDDVRVGDGPFMATIVKISYSAGSAFVDAGIGRRMGRNSHGGNGKKMTHVLGMLRFGDLDLLQKVEEVAVVEMDEDDEEEMLMNQFVEKFDDDEGNEKDDEDDDDDEDEFDDGEEGEIVEDITEMFQLSEDGMLMSQDGKAITMLGIDEGDDSFDEDDEEDELFEDMTPSERLAAIGDMLAEEEGGIKPEGSATKTIVSTTQMTLKDRIKSLQKGQEIPIYIKSVSKQSGRYMVTCNPDDVVGKAGKVLKQESLVEKRLKKLNKKKRSSKSNVLDSIQDLAGMECNGIIKAKSKTGNWFYVKPTDGDSAMIDELPVGVATLNTEQESTLSLLKAGDSVRVRLEGIDENRGQLSMVLLEQI